MAQLWALNFTNFNRFFPQKQLDLKMPFMAYLRKSKYPMKKEELILKLSDRKNKLGISLENLAKLSHVGVRTVNRLFAGEDVKLSTIEKVTNLLGVDFSGNATININELNRHRAHEKALYMASLVQQTSALEMQGLEDNQLNSLIEEFEHEFLNGSYRNTLWAV